MARRSIKLGLVDCEDSATLMVAKRIIDLASLGERDSERLVAMTVETLRSSRVATDRIDASWDGEGAVAELRPVLQILGRSQALCRRRGKREREGGVAANSAKLVEFAAST
jgi:hypothetical protein